MRLFCRRVELVKVSGHGCGRSKGIFALDIAAPRLESDLERLLVQFWLGEELISKIGYVEYVEEPAMARIAVDGDDEGDFSFPDDLH